MNSFQKIFRVVYLLVMIVCLGLYLWGGLNGYRLLGDDADTKERHDGFTRGHHSAHGVNRFYHK